MPRAGRCEAQRECAAAPSRTMTRPGRMIEKSVPLNPLRLMPVKSGIPYYGESDHKILAATLSYRAECCQGRDADVRPDDGLIPSAAGKGVAIDIDGCCGKARAGACRPGQVGRNVEGRGVNVA